jgi:hypothetical protein
MGAICATERGKKCQLLCTRLLIDYNAVILQYVVWDTDRIVKELENKNKKLINTQVN